jgi:hypothetical protein
MQHDIQSETIAYVRENFDLLLRSGRYSTGLIRELADMQESRSGIWCVAGSIDEILSTVFDQKS